MTGHDRPAAGTLWTRASHDLRQPIQSLLLLSHVMVLSDDRAQRQTTARSMEDALQALQTMLDDLPMIAKLDAGVLVPVAATIALAPVLATILEAVVPVGAAHGLDCKKSLEPATIKSDRRLLEVLLRGLALNAAKLAKPGEFAIKCTQRGAAVQVEFHFKGPAPSTAQRDAVFIELRRTVGGASAAGAAPGLGLLAVLARHLNCTLSHRSETADRQILSVTIGDLSGLPTMPPARP